MATSTVVAVVFAFVAAVPDLSAQSFGSGPTGTIAGARLLEVIDHYTGVAGRVDDARARALLLEVARELEGNDGGAGVLTRMWIARVHSTGRMGFEPDASRAREVAAEVIDGVRALAASGDVEALFLMGTAYDESLGVERDFVEARRWYGRAAARGHVLATHNVGNMYRDGRGVEVDHAAATRWWLRAARAGDVVPALRLGEAYETGRGVPPSLDVARYWYGRAAAGGNRDAEAALARLGGAQPLL